MKKVAIIIINWNSLKLGYAPDLASSLNKIDYSKDDYRIWVWDNASADGSAEYIKTNCTNVEIFPSAENLGFSPSNNKLVAQAIDQGFDYAYLLNHDTVVEPDFLTKVVEMGESEEKIGSVQSRLILFQDKTKINSIGNAIHYLGFGFSLGGYEPVSNFKREEWNKKEIAYASGAGVLLKLSAIKITGVFDEDFFMYHEDLDLGWKLMLAGYKNVLAFDSVVYHKYEFSKSVQKYYYMERNRYIVLLENYRLGTLLLIALPLLIFDLGVLIFSIPSGFYKQKLKVYGYFFHLTTWKNIVARRKIKQCYRKVGDREILKVFSGKITNQHINNWLLLKVVNPFFNLYFKILKLVIFW